MKKRALYKDIFRQIKNNFTRFLSILLLSVLGVFVLVGLKVTGPMMRQTATDYTIKENMYDISVTSPLGLNEKDISVIEENKEIEYAEKIFSVDLILPSEKLAIRLESLSDKISKPTLTQGRYPEKIGEIAIEETPDTDDIKIGQTITFSKESDKLKLDDKKDILKTYRFKVVGKIITTDYIFQGIKGLSVETSSMLDTVGYVSKDNFDTDIYGFYKIKTKGSKNLDPEDDEYISYNHNIKEEIKSALKLRIDEKTTEQKDKIRSQIQKAENEIDEKSKELEDAKLKLDDAKKKLDENSKKIENSKIKLKNEYEKAKNEIEANEIELQENEKQLKQSIENFAGENAELDGINVYLEEKNKEIAENEQKIESSKKELNLALDEIKKASQEIKSKKEELEKIKENTYSIISGEKKRELDESLKQILNKEQELNEKNSEINQKLSILKEQEEQLKTSKEQLIEQKEQIESTKENLDNAKLQLKDAKEKLDVEYKKNLSLIMENEKKLNNNQKDYDYNLKKYNDAKNKADKKILEAKDKIDDAKELMENLEAPAFTVGTRKDDSYLNFLYTSGENLDIVSMIFPLFFFFVAILVSVTTMTRMVEEQRITIGTYKAIGYTTFDVLKKYLIYGVSASVIGGIIGAALGSTILPKIIYNAYSASFTIKKLEAMQSVGINILAIVISVVINIIAIISVTLSTLREQTANLLRAKIPKKSKKILLERAKFLWNKISFLGKVTLRNVFRYKARMFMTVFGLAGCTGLLFLGFGLKESIKSLIDKQYGEILKYEILVTHDENIKDSEKDEILNILDERSLEYIGVRIDNITVNNTKSADQKVTVMTILDNENLDHFFTFEKAHYFKRNETKELETYLTSKKLLKFSENNALNITKNNLESISLTDPEGIEFYSGHFIFMTRDFYQKNFSPEIKQNGIIIKIDENTDKEEIKSLLRANNHVLTLSDSDDMTKMIKDWMKSINTIVYIILICSALLAFIVLYNLMNITIEERKKELSTIKVLGFTNQELTNYVYRETYILCFFGIIAGYLIGWGLLYLVCEVLPGDEVMLNTHISVFPYIYSGLITALFTVFVRVVVTKILSKINMVEALKSVE